MSIPLLFTLPPSSRHEIILLPSSLTSADSLPKNPLKTLNKQITTTISQSPNCAEFMSKYKSAENKEIIQEFKIHWDLKNRDSKIWPEYTVLTDENFGAVVEMLKVHPGRDVLEVKVGKDE